MSSIPGRGIGVKEKILATPSVGVSGEAHKCKYKRVDWSSNKKCSHNELIAPPQAKINSHFLYFKVAFCVKI